MTRITSVMVSWADLPQDQPTYDEVTDTLIRQSLIGDMQLCEYRVKLSDEEGYLQAVSEPLVFGTCVHYMIAQDLISGEPRLDLLGNMHEWVEEILQNEYDWTLDQVPKPRDFFGELTVAYRKWRTEVFPKLPQPLALEEEIFLYLGEGQNGNHFLKGTPDAIFSDVIMDWKTAGRGWKENKGDYSIQASLYMALVKQYTGESIQKFTFFIYNKQARRWEPQKTERKVREINAALISARDYAHKIEAGAYTATPVTEEYFKKKRGWYCSPKYCGAWNVCPVKYLADNVNEKEIAIRSW